MKNSILTIALLLSKVVFSQTETNIYDNADRRTVINYPNGDKTITDRDPMGNITRKIRRCHCDDLPNAQITPLTAQNICLKDSVLISTDSIIGVKYIWSNGDTTQKIKPHLAGFYFCTILYPDGCKKITPKVQISVRTIIIDSIKQSKPKLCEPNDSLILTMSGNNSYLWNNGISNKSIAAYDTGWYNVRITDTNGCIQKDTIYIARYLKIPLIITTTDSVLCPFESAIITPTIGFSNFIWSNGYTGATLNTNTSGTYYLSCLDSNLCLTKSNSISIKNAYPNSSSFSQTICSNQSYLWNGIVLNSTGAYNDTFQSFQYCDSIVTLNLKVNSVKTNSISVSICAGQNYLWNGIFQTNSGFYKDTFFTTLGCDSIVTLNLIVNPIKATSFSKTICSNSSYLWNGNYIKTSGTYLDTFQTYLGCDSIVTLNLYINNVKQAIIKQNYKKLYVLNPPFNSYLWSNGSVYDTMKMSTIGNFNVITVDSNNCIDTSSILVSSFCTNLVGSYSVGKSYSDFENLKDVCDVLKSCPISGSCTFLLENGRYVNQAIVLDSIPLSASKTVTFKARNNADSVAIVGLNDTFNYAIVVNNTSFLTFSDLTFEFSKMTKYGTRFSILNSNYCNIKNCKFKLLGNSNSNSLILKNSNYLNFENNRVVNYTNSSIWLNGNYSSHCTVKNNYLVGAPSGQYNMNFQYGSNNKILYNKISHSLFIEGSNDSIIGNQVNSLNLYGTIARNNYLAYDTINYTLQIWGANKKCKMEYCIIGQMDKLSADSSEFINNFIIKGGEINSCNYMNFFHNTVKGQLKFSFSSSNVKNQIFNNIFYSDNAIISPIYSSNYIGFASNFNHIFNSKGGLLYGGKYSFSNLISMQNTTGLDLKSISDSIEFVSLISPKLKYWTSDNGCDPLAIFRDIDNKLRSIISPDWGCWEYGSIPRCDSFVSLYSLKDTICKGEEVSLYVVGAKTYNWLGPIDSSHFINGNSNAIKIKLKSSSSISVIGNKLGCIDTATKFIYVRPRSSDTLNYSKSKLCKGIDSIKLEVKGNSSVLWSNGQNSKIIFIKDTGLIIVNITEPIGCIYTDSIKVGRYNFIPNIISCIDTSLCPGQVTQINASPLFNNFEWNINSTSNKIFVDTTGSFFVLANDSNGCRSQSNIINTILVSPITPNFSKIGNQLCLTPTFISYQWNNGASSPCITVPATGIYSVTVSDTNGCVSNNAYNVGGGCSPISGTFIIGSGPYPTLKSIISKMETCGINGPMTVKIPNGKRYESIYFSDSIIGSSNINQIIFESLSHKDSTIIAGDPANNVLVKLNNNSFFIIRKLIFEVTTAVSNSNSYYLENSKNIVFDSCNFHHLTFPKKSNFTTSFCNKIEVKNSLQSNQSDHTMEFHFDSTSYSKINYCKFKTIIITGNRNEIHNTKCNWLQTRGDKFYVYNDSINIYDFNMHNSKVEKNVITGLFQNWINYQSKNDTIISNRIFNGLHFWGLDTVFIINNEIIYANGALNYSSGIDIKVKSAVIYNNSIFQSSISANGWPCVRITDGLNIEFKNNVLKTNQVSSNCLKLDNTPISKLNCSNNNYSKTNGTDIINANGVVYNSLSSWKAMGKDSFSLNDTVIFNSTIDLHISCGGMTNKAGINKGIVEDKDEVIRTDPPDIGAFEFSCYGSFMKPLNNNKIDSMNNSSIQNLKSKNSDNNSSICNDFLLVPNPSHTTTLLTFNSSYNIVTIKVIDQSDKVIFYSYFQNPQKSININIDNFAIGTYIISITADGFNCSKKFIKQ